MWSSGRCISFVSVMCPVRTIEGGVNEKPADQPNIDRCHKLYIKLSSHETGKETVTIC